MVSGAHGCVCVSPLRCAVWLQCTDYYVRMVDGHASSLSHAPSVECAAVRMRTLDMFSWLECGACSGGLLLCCIGRAAFGSALSRCSTGHKHSRADSSSHSAPSTHAHTQLYGCIMFCSLIGIPFALAHWRLMVLALWPFGAELSSYETVHTTVTTHTAVNYESV